MTNKKNKIYRNYNFYIIIFLIIFSTLFSCTSNDKVIKTYSYFPAKENLDDIFNSNDYAKIMKYFTYFQNSDDITFLEALNKKMDKFLSDSLISSLNEKSNIYEIVRNINNYIFFKNFVGRNANSFDNNKLNYYDENIQKSLDYIFKRLEKIDNYYLYNSYIYYLKSVFPFYNDNIDKLKEQKYEKDIFISSYEDVYKNSVMVILDKGIKIENGRSVPDISIGTGFFIDKNKIVTNYHVINSDGKKFMLSVKLNSFTFSANIVLFDEVLDIAIIEIPYENSNFKYFKISDKVKIGDEVIASGNPYGLSFSNTKGIISNLDRKFLEIGHVIQIDAPLNPGNSGGPVFTPNFELIGIAFASISNTQNLNFILPVSFMLDCLTNLNINIEVQRSWLGFYFYEDKILYQTKGTINYQIAKNFQINDYSSINFLYLNDKQIIKKDYFILMQHYVSILPEYSLVPVSYNNKTYFLLSERRPKYPMNYAISHDEINNCLSMIFDSNLKKESDYYKIEKIYNPDISLFYGLFQGDMIKILAYQINSTKKVVIIYLSVKYPRYGYSTQQISVVLSFSQPGFF